MPLDPAVENLLALVNNPDAVPINQQTPVEARAQFAALIALLGYAGETSPTVVERTIESVPCQIITPASSSDAPLPVLIYIHGGGWVIGDAALYESLCRDLAVRVGCVVVNVDYRRAPEDPHPAAPDDCTAVARWVIANARELGGREDRVAVAGDSAGGNLSAVVANEVPGLAAQVLIYPVTDATASHPSYEENAEGYFLTRADMLWFIDLYVGSSGDTKNPRVSPLFTDADVLAASPRALVITAEYDPLRDEGEAYAAALRDAGADVVSERYDGMIHGFVQLHPVIPAGAQAIDQIVEFLRAALT